MLTPSPDSIEELYRAQYAPLYRLAFALTGVPRAAEDLVQDVFTRAQRDRHQLVGHPNVSAWLRRAVINASVSRWRRLRTEAAYLARRQVVHDVQIPDHERELWDAVRRLPVRQRQVIALVYVEDLTVTDAAAVMGCSAETARTHHRRGLTTLASALGNEGPRDEHR